MPPIGLLTDIVPLDSQHLATVCDRDSGARYTVRSEIGGLHVHCPATGRVWTLTHLDLVNLALDAGLDTPKP